MTFDKAARLIKRGNLAALRDALDSGLDPNLSNRFSWTLLMMAALAGNVGIGRLLMAKGADVQSANDGGETALSLAAQQGHLPFVELMLSYGASLECRPHGHDLDEWITRASGLPEEKIAAILGTIERARSGSP
jgi:ankyrin repeat protein